MSNDSQKEKRKQGFIIAGIFYALLLFITLHFLAVRNAGNQEAGILNNLLETSEHLSKSPLGIGGAFADVGFALKVLGIITIAFVMVAVYVWTDAESRSHADSKTAKGSSEFNADYKGFAKKYALAKQTKDEDEPDRNIILGKNLKYGIVKGRNTNVVILGSAGSGKSFGIIKPNLMQMNTSYVITDPSGEIFQAEAKMLLENGYNVKIFSTSEMAYSNCYNPFDYVYSEDGSIDETRVSIMINMFLQNATDLQNNRGDKFWDQASKAILTACAMLLLEFFPEQNRNMYEMLCLVQKGKVDEKESNNQTGLDDLFNKARKINPEAHCFSSYDTFKLAPARTANSILISAAVDLNMFNQTKVRNLTTTAYQIKQCNEKGYIRAYSKDSEGNLIRTDENIDLRTIGDEKTCLFINIPQADSTYNFLVTMLYSQLFDILYGRAEKICPNKWMVTDQYGDPVLSMLDSKEDAEALIDLYKNARVIEKHEAQRQNGSTEKTVYYIYNREADRKYGMPGYAKGILKKVWSKEVGEKFIRKFDDCNIEKGKKRLPWHIQCLLDEFSNVGAVPEYPQKLATMRKYEISCMIVLQSLAQLKNRYEKLYSDILSNCDCTVFLGSTDPETCKYISQDRLGKKTIRVMNKSRSSSGRGKNSSLSYNLDARDLMTQNEVAELDKNRAIVLVGGEKPFYVEKYKASDHFRWKQTGDVDPDKSMNPKDLIVCGEKKTSSKMDSEGMASWIKQGAMQAPPRMTKAANVNESMASAGINDKKNIKATSKNEKLRTAPENFVEEFVVGDEDGDDGSSFTSGTSAKDYVKRRRVG